MPDECPEAPRWSGSASTRRSSTSSRRATRRWISWRLVDAGKVELLSTHVQRDELADVTDPVKRERIARIPTSDVPTYGFVIGFSRLDMARLGPAEPYEAMTGENRVKYARDALIAMTAEFEGTILVSEDRRMRNRASSKLRVDAWPWSRFIAHLRSLDS